VRTLFPIILLALIALTSCQVKSHSKKAVANQNKESQDSVESHFKLLNASKENWVAGIPAGGRGTEYFFKIKITTQQKLVFADLWVDNYMYSISVANNSASISDKPIEYGNGDEITLRASVLSSQNYELSKAPVQHAGDALIGYTSNGITQYLIVENITEKPTLNRP